MKLRQFVPLFLLSLVGCNDIPKQQVTLPEKIDIAIRVNPASYYWIQNQTTGLDYDLAQLFAKQFTTKINFIPVANMQDALDLLDTGKVAIATGALTTNNLLNEKYTTSPAYYHTEQKILYRHSQNINVQSLAKLPMSKIDVSPHPIHIESLRKIKEKYEDSSYWHLVEESSHQLLQLLNDGFITYTIADAIELDLTRIFYPYIKELKTLEDKQPMVWFLAKEPPPDLAQAVTQFFNDLSNTRELQRILNKHYFSYKLEYDHKITFIEHFNTRLPKYKKYFIDVAKQLNLDWKFLAAIAYQESHWRAKAVSPTQVKGIMMITRKTAQQYKIKNRLDPYSSISGGSQHFVDVKNKLNQDIAEPDRSWMALAAYNIGWGHLQDAIQLTKHIGGNTKYWIDIAKSLDLLRTKEWEHKSKHGIPKGGDATLYVNNIRIYYRLIRWLSGDIDTTIKHTIIPDTYTPPR